MDDAFVHSEVRCGNCDGANAVQISGKGKRYSGHFMEIRRLDPATNEMVTVETHYFLYGAPNSAYRVARDGTWWIVFPEVAEHVWKLYDAIEGTTITALVTPHR